MLILTVSLFAAATAIAWWRLAPLHPAQLWLTVWTLGLGLLALRLLPYRPLADKTLVLIAISSLAFVVASYLAGRFLPPRRGPPPPGLARSSGPPRRCLRPRSSDAGCSSRRRCTTSGSATPS